MDIADHVITSVESVCYGTYYIYQGIPVNVTLFLNNFKRSKDRTKLMDGKEAGFYDNFFDINDPTICHYTTP